MRLRRRLLALLPIAALGLCASIVSARSSGTSDTVLFGAAVSFTGREAREGRLTQEGYDFWKDYVNSHGGLRVGAQTYKVAIKYYDDETNPQTAARLIEKLIDDDHVNFILGPYGSSSSFTAAGVVERKQIPMVEANGAAERIFNQGYRYTFAVLSPARRYLEGVVELALHQRPKPNTIAVTAANDAFSQEVQQGAIDFATAHGLRVVYATRYPVDTSDVSGIVSAIKATKPDLILNAGHLQDALLIHRGLKEQNVLAALYGYSVGPDTPDFGESLGKDANYVFGGAQWSISAKYEGTSGFYTTSAEYTIAFTKAYGHLPDYHNAESSAACLAFQYAIRNAHSLEPQRVREALASLDVMTFYGRVKFDARGLNMYKPMVTNQIRRGKLITVWPPFVAVDTPLYPAPEWSKR